MEFAVVAPLFFLVLAGIMEFGQAFRIQHLLSNACRRGARSAIVSGASTDHVKNNVWSQCNSLLGVSSTSVGVTVKVNGTDADVSTAVKGDQIDVTVSIPYSKAGVGFFCNTFVNANLSSTCILEHE